jgi:hypothetical protein
MSKNQTPSAPVALLQSIRTQPNDPVRIGAILAVISKIKSVKDQLNNHY